MRMETAHPEAHRLDGVFAPAGTRVLAADLKVALQSVTQTRARRLATQSRKKRSRERRAHSGVHRDHCTLRDAGVREYSRKSAVRADCAHIVMRNAFERPDPVIIAEGESAACQAIERFEPVLRE